MTGDKALYVHIERDDKMACFLVPTAEAVITTVVTKAQESREKNTPDEKIKSTKEVVKIPLSRKLKWLNRLLFGGAFLLAFEHLWHGEIAPYFPFLTAASDPEALSDVLYEMATTGVTMAALITGVWAVMCVVADRIVKRDNEPKTIGDSK